MTALQRSLAPVALICLSASVSEASELSYTYMDFLASQNTVTAVGSQLPVASQLVQVRAGDGDGIAVGGSMVLRNRFYLVGSFSSSIVDVSGVVTNPFGVTEVADNFDLIQSRFGFGYVQPIGETFDLVGEVSYDTSDYDFGSFAGENFDMAEGGAGAKVGFRWNPTLPFEFYAFARYSSVGKANLTLLEYETDTLANAGFRWYFFEDLGVGLDFESGEVETVTFSMRFSFGNLPW